MSNPWSFSQSWSLAQPQRQQTTSGYAAAPDKRNVNLLGVNPQLLQVANEVGNSLFGKLNRPLLITSARDSQHAPRSLHYGGGALDLRTRDLNPQQRQEIVAQFRAKGLTAVDEGDHIHVAMPRSGYNPAAAPGTVGRDLQMANASPGAGTPGASNAPTPPPDLPSIAGMTSPFDTPSDDSLGGALAQAAASADDGLTEAPRTVDPAAYLTDPRIPKLAEVLTAANAQQAAPTTPVLDETAPLFNIKNIGQAKQFKPRRIT